MIRITTICPIHLMDDANHFMMAIGGPADGATFTGGPWEDATGARYSVASALVDESWLSKTQEVTARPVWDATSSVVDLAAAERARAALRIDIGPDAFEATQRSDRQITVVAWPSPQAVLATYGLKRVRS